MSDNDDKKRRPLKNLPPDGFPAKMILIWMAVIVMIWAVINYSQSKLPTPARLKIQQVVELAEQGQIAEGYIRPDSTGGRDWSELTGKTKENILKSETGATSEFIAAGRLTDGSLERLQKTSAFVEKPATMGRREAGCSPGRGARAATARRTRPPTHTAAAATWTRSKGMARPMSIPVPAWPASPGVIKMAAPAKAATGGHHRGSR